MEKRDFGKTGLQVTPLGFGAAEIGMDDVDSDGAAQVLDSILAAGITVIDTAACYGDSEVKIGKALASRRDEFVLITKCGHRRDDLTSDEWSPRIVGESIDRSLRRLQTDCVDVLLLHSCGREKLTDELLDALAAVRRQGKARHVGYSGDGDDARAAVEMEPIEALEISLNIVDQEALDETLPIARRRGLGVIVKRPVANAAWKGLDGRSGFYSDYVRPYVERLEEMGLTPESVGFDGSWIELALRFSAHREGVSTVIVGTTSREHLRDNVAIVEKGPLPKDVVAAVRDLWAAANPGTWVGQI